MNLDERRQTAHGNLETRRQAAAEDVEERSLASAEAKRKADWDQVEEIQKRRAVLEVKHAEILREKKERLLAEADALAREARIRATVD